MNPRRHVWKYPWRPLREPAPGEDRPADDRAGDEPSPETWAPLPEATATPPGAGEEFHPTLLIAVDDDHAVAVSLGDQPPNAILEMTQRAREARDRERSGVPPVHDFGGSASAWTGPGGDW